MRGEVEQPLVMVEVTTAEDVVIAVVRDDVDHDTFREIRSALFSCMASRAAALVVDLDDVGFFGSIGIAVLLEIRQRADQMGMRFAVVAGRRTVARPIRLTDTQDLLRVQRTREDALAAVRRHPRFTGHLDDPIDTGPARSRP
ncbi:STAS domain-containing protein [Lentzea sp. CC55]|uniref:STAS domain-containing protein n=1 Tax=Lentzea sp. CC55 TaxID=2884909 RepID=UPI001F1FCDD1|nr:STAS domain-containing protein [Lentzea sp. CC55]MCG8925622.1 STAS domain-containing protein [Lentzea sp. CC55]